MKDDRCIWLCDVTPDMDVSVFLTNFAGKPGIRFVSMLTVIRRNEYFLSQVVMSYARGGTFDIRTPDGEPMLVISRYDLARICERAICTLEGEGICEMVFTEHDMSIPF
jgi:hypothetical protein